MRVPVSWFGSACARRPVLLAGLCALLPFALLTALFRLPFLADDYFHLGLAETSSLFDLEPLGTYVTRVPLWALTTKLVFAARGAPWLWMHVFFFVHALSLAALARWLLGELACPPQGRRDEVSFVAVAAVCALFPTFYEILLWPTCFPYVLGAGFLALGLRRERAAPRVLLCTLSWLTSEMFVLPALVLLCGAPLLRAALARSWRAVDGREWWLRLGTWLAALGLTVLVRVALSQRFGSYAYELRFDLEHVLSQMQDSLLLLFTLHFHGIGWWPTAIFWLLVGVLVVRLAWKGRVSLAATPLLALGAWLAGANYWVFGHGAARAMYGPGLLVCAGLAFLLWRFCAAERAAFRAALLGVAAVLFLGHTTSLLLDKDHNARVLEQRVAELAAELESCAAPCTITLRRLDAGLRKDWTLGPGYWRYFGEWVQRVHAPGKDVRFVVAEP